VLRHLDDELRERPDPLKAGAHDRAGEAALGWAGVLALPRWPDDLPAAVSPAKTTQATLEAGNLCAAHTCSVLGLARSSVRCGLLGGSADQ
jgi:hypothetical protein